MYMNMKMKIVGTRQSFNKSTGKSIDGKQQVQKNVIVTAWKYESKYKSGKNLQKGF